MIYWQRSWRQRAFMSRQSWHSKFVWTVSHSSDFFLERGFRVGNPFTSSVFSSLSGFSISLLGSGACKWMDQFEVWWKFRTFAFSLNKSDHTSFKRILLNTSLPDRWRWPDLDVKHVLLCPLVYNIAKKNTYSVSHKFLRWYLIIYWNGDAKHCSCIMM